MFLLVLGTEESCTGDPAKRAGNEFLFQMQAMMNIEVLNAYEAKKIVTACPHCFNTLKMNILNWRAIRSSASY
jgi:Fe-S oxidoreductase